MVLHVQKNEPLHKIDTYAEESIDEKKDTQEKKRRNKTHKRKFDQCQLAIEGIPLNFCPFLRMHELREDVKRVRDKGSMFITISS